MTSPVARVLRVDWFNHVPRGRQRPNIWQAIQAATCAALPVSSSPHLTPSVHFRGSFSSRSRRDDCVVRLLRPQTGFPSTSGFCRTVTPFVRDQFSGFHARVALGLWDALSAEGLRSSGSTRPHFHV
ncbi:hypothetical protein Q5P01_024189 [Channa striata]|uniref:Uncharacterized protein n=1 Tax=Channa striata TaxID=64152 RepID=A0AA88IPV1_CHASR|nr:hypothetical protein Q5P01_024189 [Channa striata]